MKRISEMSEEEHLELIENCSHKTAIRSVQHGSYLLVCYDCESRTVHSYTGYEEDENIITAEIDLEKSTQESIPSIEKFLDREIKSLERRIAIFQGPHRKIFNSLQKLASRGVYIWIKH